MEAALRVVAAAALLLVGALLITSSYPYLGPGLAAIASLLLLPDSPRCAVATLAYDLLVAIHLAGISGAAGAAAAFIPASARWAKPRLDANAVPELVAASVIAAILLWRLSDPTLALLAAAASLEAGLVYGELTRLRGAALIRIVLAATAFLAPGALPALAESIARLGCSSGPVPIGDALEELRRIPLLWLILPHKWMWSRLPAPTPCSYDARSAPNPHVLVVGSSGAGKSVAAALIAASMTRGYGAKLLVIDPHGEYHALLPIDAMVINAASLKFNPLALAPGETPRDRAELIADILREAYHIGPLQSTLLIEAILACYEEKGLQASEPHSGGGNAEFPTVDDVATKLYRLARDVKAAYALAGYVRSLAGRGAGSEEIDIQRVLKGNVILDLSRVPSLALQRVLVETLLRLLLEHYRRLGPTSEIRHVIVVDEAHRYAPRGGRSVVQVIAREARKYGVALVAVTQSPRDLDESVILNAAAKYALRLEEPRSLSYAARMVAGYEYGGRAEAIKEKLHEAPTGYAVVKHPESGAILYTRLPPLQD